MVFSEYTPDWPDWAPKPVIKEWQKEFDQHVECCGRSMGKIDNTFIRMTYFDEPSIMALFERILTNPAMEKVWDKIKVLNIRPDLFSTVLRLAYYGPQGINKKTENQQSVWADKVQSLSLELANLLEYTELDDYLFKDFKKADTNFILTQVRGFVFNTECKCDGKAPPCKVRFPYRPPRVPELLRKISNDAQKVVNGEYQALWGVSSKKVFLPSPGKDEAPHLYFIRYLSSFFLEQTKGKNLFREYVRICAEVAYGKKFSTSKIEYIAKRSNL